MDDMTVQARAQVTNDKVGRDLGITHSAVSRIRSGQRLPSLALVRKIEATFGWSVADQVASLNPKDYAIRFEQILSRRYDQ